jgi:hypothetical protein
MQMIEKAKLKKKVYSALSDKRMIILALIAIPIIIAEYIIPTGTAFWIALVLDWMIWFVFLAEFVLKVYVEKDNMTYIRNNKFDSALSIIIILSPLLGLITNVVTGIPALRAIRASRLFAVARTARVSRAIRAAAYASKMFRVKNKD